MGCAGRHDVVAKLPKTAEGRLPTSSAESLHFPFLTGENFGITFAPAERLSKAESFRTVLPFGNAQVAVLTRNSPEEKQLFVAGADGVWRIEVRSRLDGSLGKIHAICTAGDNLIVATDSYLVRLSKNALPTFAYIPEPAHDYSKGRGAQPPVSRPEDHPAVLNAAHQLFHNRTEQNTRALLDAFEVQRASAERNAVMDAAGLTHIAAANDPVQRYGIAQGRQVSLFCYGRILCTTKLQGRPLALHFTGDNLLATAENNGEIELKLLTPSGEVETF